MNGDFSEDALVERDSLLPSISVSDLLRDTLEKLRRHWQLLVTTVVVFTVLAVLYALIATPTFTANGAILIDPRVGQAPERNAQLAPGLLISDALTVDSELRVLLSREVTVATVRALGLEPAQPKGPTLHQRLSALLEFGAPVSKEFETPEIAAEFQKERQFERLRTSFIQNLKVQRAGESFVIDVSYTSPDLKLAANAVNTLIAEYLRLSSQKNIDQVERNRTWLSDRIDDLDTQLRDAEAVMTGYRRANNLLVREGSLLPSEMAMNAAISELVRLQSVAISIETRSQLLGEQIASGSVSAVQIPIEERTSALGDFESRLAELQQRENELLLIREDNGQAVLELRKLQDQTRALIVSEYEKIQEQLAAKADALGRQKRSTEDLVTDLREEYAIDSVKMLELRSLERDADSKRELHKRLLLEYNNSSQLLTFDAVPARVISWAAPPDVKSSPKSKQIVILAVFGGLILAFGGIFAIEAFDQSFRKPSDLVENLGLPFLGIISTCSSEILGAAVPPRCDVRKVFHGLPGSARKLDFVTAWPSSLTAETLNNVHVNLALSLEEGTPPNDVLRQGVVLGLTSSASDEGKTTTAFNLAVHLAEQSEKVLLIDLDLTSRDLTNHIKPALPDRNVLQLFMADPEEARDNITAIPEFPGLDIIGNTASSKQSLVVLSDFYALEAMLKTLRARYDYIVVDLPPLQGVQNTSALANLCDRLIFLVSWGKVPQKLVQSALRKLAFPQERIVGILFTCASLRRYRSYNLNEFADYHG